MYKNNLSIIDKAKVNHPGDLDIAKQINDIFKGKALAGGIRPLKAIRLKCLECAGSRKAVRKCETTDCALHGFKEGRNPHRRGLGRSGGNPALNSHVRL